MFKCLMRYPRGPVNCLHFKTFFFLLLSGSSRSPRPSSAPDPRPVCAPLLLARFTRSVPAVFQLGLRLPPPALRGSPKPPPFHSRLVSSLVTTSLTFFIRPITYLHFLRVSFLWRFFLFFHLRDIILFFVLFSFLFVYRNSTNSSLSKPWKSGPV